MTHHHRLLLAVCLGVAGAVLIAAGIVHAAFADHRTEFEKRLARESCDQLYSDLLDSRAAANVGMVGAQGRAVTIHDRMMATGC